MSDKIVLELKNITKVFPGVKALDNVRFDLREGEVHALMGENGAGKSTLIKVITGVYQCDEGEIFFDSKPVEIKTPLEAQKLGVAVIYQTVTAFPDLSVTENIFMGQELKNKFGFYKWKEMHKRAKALLDQLGSDIDVEARMGTLSVAKQQLVEIAKALSKNARILIMDEPTASLTQHECEDLYRIVEKLRDSGVSIIFITHKFEDMYRLASRVTVFRDSGYIGTWPVNGISNAKLIEAMVGRKLEQMYPPKTAVIGETVFEVENLGLTGYFKNVSFTVRRGEIVALTGLVGAGRTEVMQAIYGVLHPDSGCMKLNGKKIVCRNPQDALRQGIGLLPEDRHLQGLVLDMPIYQNITLSNLIEYRKLHLFLNRAKEKADADVLCKKIAVKASSVETAPSFLSGGNQQKVALAKLLRSKLKVLIVDEPTKGIDVGAKYSIYTIMNELAASGYAIIMISSEMPEVLGMADRIIVMKNGRVTAELERGEADQEKILRAAITSVNEQYRQEAV